MSFIPSKHSKISSGLRIYLVRHAESLNNIMCHDHPGEYENIRSHDPVLSETGHQQAQQLARYIKQHEHLSEICEIHCSAMHRSLLTSQYLQRELGINPEIWVEIHEVKGCRELNKAYPGLKRSEIESEFPGFVIPEGCTESGWFLRDDAESEEEAWERSGRVWSRLKAMSREEKYQGKSIIIITHGLFLDFLVGRICGRTMKGGKNYSDPRFIFFNTGISFLWIIDEKPYIFFLDRIEHLAVMPLMYREGELD